MTPGGLRQWAMSRDLTSWKPWIGIVWNTVKCPLALSTIDALQFNMMYDTHYCIIRFFIKTMHNIFPGSWCEILIKLWIGNLTLFSTVFLVHCKWWSYCAHQVPRGNILILRQCSLWIHFRGMGILKKSCGLDNVTSGDVFSRIISAGLVVLWKNYHILKFLEDTALHLY